MQSLDQFVLERDDVSHVHDLDPGVVDTHRSILATEAKEDWTALEKAFNEKSTIVGKVTGLIKGGFSVDVGVRAFMPASRSGVRDAAEMANLVEQEIRCRITKLDVAEEDLVVDRRVVLEEEERSTKEQRYTQVKEGDIVTGTIRNLAGYGAFVDIGGVDGLLHVSEIANHRVKDVREELKEGEQLLVKVINIDPTGKIRLSRKALLQEEAGAAKKE